ncbi:hypothetical protein MauCBS54593_002454 [Microsporum audouinii]
MGGGESFPGFPHPNPTVSYWQVPPHDIANHRTTPALPTSTKFDYIIVGSGISGAAIAHKLLARNAGLSILMLEARTSASGASGRNGGHCRAGFWLNYSRYAQALGEDEALKFERLEEANIQDIADFVRDYHVDCDFANVETADVYVTQEEWAAVLDVVEAREEVKRRKPDLASSIRRTVLHGEEARKHMGMPAIVGAITWPAHTQNPYRLVCRMLELSLEKGLNLQTTTTALDITAHTQGDGWLVNTDRGTVHASRVVLATNAYTAPLHRGLAATGFLTTARSQLAALRPGNNMLDDPEALLRGSAGLNDAGSGDYFMYRAQDCHLIYGGGRSHSKAGDRNTTNDAVVNPDVANYLHRAPPQFFSPEAWGDDSRVVRDWCGITCYTPDTFPLVGESPGQNGLWMSVGMNGHGMAMAFRCAEALVEMMTTGKEPEWFPKSFRLQRAWEKPIAEFTN